jgi:membrane protein
MLGVLWLAAGSGATLLKAMNRIYEIEETRPFWERYLVGLWLTLLGGSVLAGVILLMSAGQMLGQQAGGDAAPGWFWPVASFARWPLLLAILVVEAGVVFRVAPNSKPAWRFITPGALLFAVGCSRAHCSWSTLTKLVGTGVRMAFWAEWLCSSCGYSSRPLHCCSALS